MKRLAFFVFLMSFCFFGNAKSMDIDIENSFQGTVLCATASQCLANTTASMPCCCPTGGTGVVTMYECPVGWIYSVDLRICVRSSTTGSDSSGYYTQNYGTCEPANTIQESNCYTLSASDTSTGSAIRCQCNSDYMGGGLV